MCGMSQIESFTFLYLAYATLFSCSNNCVNIIIIYFCVVVINNKIAQLFDYSPNLH